MIKIFQFRKYQDFRTKQIESLKNSPQSISPNLYFTKQTVSNACGTVALIHSLANNKEPLEINCNLLRPFEFI